MNKNKHKRQIDFFGAAGQEKLVNEHAVIVGVGGVGSHISQQLAYLGVGRISIIDDDILDDTSFNRLIGLTESDTAGTLKVDIIHRYIKSIDPTIQIQKLASSFISTNGFLFLKQATVVFGCIDNDGARLVLNEFCLAYDLLYIDVASDILPDGTEYGGRVITITNNQRCLYCLDQIDTEQAGRDLENPAARKDRETIYGVDKKLLNGTGPSVVSINGIVASLAVTEYMLHITGKRTAIPYLNYSGNRGIVNNRTDAEKDCYYCKVVRGKKGEANLERYIKIK